MSDKWYYDTETRQVSQGVSGGFETRMGPYDSKEEAENALEIAKQRNEAADKYDEEDD
ncbi:hypothetical protein [Corynebacterium heidelbergense]|uniref:hypothetical protein n=1 Tax=Corynebacterium heidelbergense TaxID=2055947 RepID=UPI0014028B7B|nr:hypothetical protein [Corynebacterium heidelbergense]